MEYLFPTLLSVHILVGIAVIGLVLIQHGKGADMGAAFGSGASGSLFGSSGSANFLSRTTATLAAVFFMTSLGLSYIASSKPRVSGSVMENAVTKEPAAPAVEVPAPTAPTARSGQTASAAPANGNKIIILFKISQIWQDSNSQWNKFLKVCRIC